MQTSETSSTTTTTTSNRPTQQQQQRVGASIGTSDDSPFSPVATFDAFFNNNNNNRNTTRNNDNDDEDEDEEYEEEQTPQQISAEIIRTAVRNLDRKHNNKNNNNKLADYQQRLAVRELKELIRKATERCSASNVMVNRQQTSTSASTMVVRNNTTNNDPNQEFKVLREDLGRILIETEQNERIADQLSTEIQHQFWNSSSFEYTPLDLLDVLILSGGKGAATSDLIMKGLKVVHSKWKSACAAENKEAFEKLDEMELLSDWMEVLNKFNVPKKIQSQLFNQLQTLTSSSAKKIRLVVAIARAHDPGLAVREQFIERLKETSVLIRGALLQQKQMIEKRKADIAASKSSNNAPPFPTPVFAPPELFELAEDLVPRIKAWEIAVGFPFYVDDELMEQCGLVLQDENELGITYALNRVIKEEEEHSSIYY